VNTDNSEIENEIGDLPIKEKKSRSKGSALAFLAFVFSLTALGGTAWMWWQDEMAKEQGQGQTVAELARLENADSELSLKIKQVRDKVDALAGEDNSAEITALHQRLESDSGQVDSLEKTIQEQLALSRSLQSAAESMQGRLLAAEAAVSAMSSQELDAGGELDLAEVDYLLRLANERLKLFSDPLAADQALEIADMHLAAMDNPMFLGVRQDIASARGELAALEIPDYLEITSKLDAIQQSTVSIPFRGEIPELQESAAVKEADWWEKIKVAFSGLVTIRHSTEEENRRISIEDKDFVRQRLWLQLEIAHLALMRRDESAYRAALGRVQESLDTWFDTADASVQSASREINDLKELDIEVDIPDISAPWATLSLVREGRSRATALTPVENAASPQPPVSDPAAGQNEDQENRQ